MNKVIGLAMLASAAVANVSEAVVVVRPGRPVIVRPPIVVRPPVVVRPPIIVRPPVVVNPPIVVPVPPASIDYDYLDQVQYAGAGPRTESIHAQFRRADVVRVSMPVGCALTIQPQFQTEYGHMVGGGILPRVYNDGRNQVAEFRVGRNGNTVLRTIYLGMNSAYYYGYEHNCVVTVETGLEYRNYR